MDMLAMMKQAQAMQARLQEMQAELDSVEVEGRSGGGLVTVRLTAKGALKGVSIDPSLLKAEEQEIVEDLLVAAHAEARARGEAMVQERMSALTGGLPLPPGFKLPF